MMIELLLLFALILLNGVFAVSEIAVVSSRRARLMQLVESGQRGAARALELSNEPTRFLSTVQVGIVDMDGNRVDRLLITPAPKAPA